jgi:uncharacterized protein with PIN domain
MNFCFAADRTLGKLSKWLRILGFDTIYESDISSTWFYDHLGQERILLTRTGRNRRQCCAQKLVFIESNDLIEQLRQVIDELAITRDDIRTFSMCIQCNCPLIDISKETVYGLVPDYIWETHHEFHVCRKCERIYWPGSHIERSMEVIKRLFD